MKQKNLISVSGLVLISVLLALTLLSSCDGPYTKIMTRAIQKAMGKDFRGYYCPSFPTSNFGILTTYESKVTARNFICAMTSCFDTLKVNDLSIGGMADVGEGGSSLALNIKNKNYVVVKAILPELWNILKIKGTLDKNTVTNVDLKFGRAYERHLDRIKFNGLINTLPDDSYYKKQFNSGNLVVIVSDVVVENMEVTVSLSDSLSAIIEARIGESGILSNDTINGEFTRITEGQYSFKSAHPLIVLRLAKKQPQGGVLGLRETFDDWVPVTDEIGEKVK